LTFILPEYRGVESLSALAAQGLVVEFVDETVVVRH